MLVFIVLVFSALGTDFVTSGNFGNNHSVSRGDLLYLGDQIVQLPSFTPLPSCSPPRKPVNPMHDEWSWMSMSKVVNGEVIACGGEYKYLICQVQVKQLLIGTQTIFFLQI